MTSLTVSDSPKMLRETFCILQTWMGLSQRPDRQDHIDRLQRLIDDCDRHRPLGPDGTHGDRHTNTCGCEGQLSEKAHLRISPDGGNYKYACGVERNGFGSQILSGCVNPYGVTCGNCKRTKAFDAAWKAAIA